MFEVRFGPEQVAVQLEPVFGQRLRARGQVAGANLGQGRAREICGFDVRAGEVRACEVPAAEVRAAEVRAAEVRVSSGSRPSGSPLRGSRPQGSRRSGQFSRSAWGSGRHSWAGSTVTSNLRLTVALPLPFTKMLIVKWRGVKPRLAGMMTRPVSVRFLPHRYFVDPPGETATCRCWRSSGRP